MNPQEPLRVLIVDDEPLARRGLRRELEACPNAVIAGECRHGEEAVRAIEEAPPDVVLLDIDMPDLDGFEVIDTVGPQQMPAVIFVTAHDQFALKAFEAYAVDYILKPVESARFQEAIERARARKVQTTLGSIGSSLEALGQHIRAGGRYRQRVAIRDRGGLTLIPVQEIHWLEASDNYVFLHTQDGAKHLLRRTLSKLESELDPASFVRVHRSFMVRVHEVRELHPLSKGDAALRLKSGQEIPVSRRYRETLQSRLEV